MITNVNAELQQARTELRNAENGVKRLRDELSPLVRQRVEAELDGKSVDQALAKQLTIVNSAVGEAEQILSARQRRVQSLIALSANLEINETRKRLISIGRAALVEAEKSLKHFAAAMESRQRVYDLAAEESGLARETANRLREGGVHFPAPVSNSLGNVVVPGSNIDLVAAEIRQYLQRISAELDAAAETIEEQKRAAA